MIADNKDLLAQRELRDLGFYKGALDGLWGQRSTMALDAWVASQKAAVETPVRDGNEFDSRTELNLATLQPAAEFQARKFMRLVIPAMAKHGLKVKITSGNRTYTEQNALYAQGRTKKGPVVTNAPAGYSWHNFMLAWDITLFTEDGSPLYESSHYHECALIGEAMGLECGAFFKSIVDEPHYQIKTGLSLAQMRQRRENGQPII